MRLVLAAAAVLASCSKAPPPKPPPAEREVTGPASFAGSWVMSDDLDWGYTLAIQPGGQLLLTIDRGKMGRCEQKGTLEPGADPRSYKIAYTKNTCSPEYGGTPLEIRVASFTGSALSLVMSGHGAERHPTYARDPKSVQ
jgi:hypothetical protein